MWFKCSLLLVFSLSCFGEVQERPSILRTSPNQIKTVGDHVDLECVCKNVDNYVLVWQRMNSSNQKIILAAGNIRITPDRRYNLVTTNGGSDDEPTTVYTLRINDVRESDAGTYQCQISDESSVPAYIVLTVQKPFNFMCMLTLSC